MTIYGNKWNNALYGTVGDDRMVGRAGNDSFLSYDGADKMFGGDGADTFYYSHYSANDVDRAYGGGGVDSAYLFLGSETGPVSYRVGSAVKVDGVAVFFLDSVERFSFDVGSGSDHIIVGDTGSYGHGGAGNDRIVGGAIRDFFFGDADDDVLFGGGGNDELYGGSGHDALLGGEGRDILFGDDGTDRLSGSLGADALYGGAGNDSLLGGGDADVLRGEAGIDRLTGGLGADTLYGGAGHDRFIWMGTDEGGDLISDFVTGQDKLLFDDSAFGVVVIDATNFVINTAGAAQDSDDRFILSSHTRGLFYDPDGNGAEARILIAHLGPDSSTIAASDFAIV